MAQMRQPTHKLEHVGQRAFKNRDGLCILVFIGVTLVLPRASGIVSAEPLAVTARVSTGPKPQRGDMRLRKEAHTTGMKLTVISSSGRLSDPSPCLRLRGGVSKYYNHTASPNRGGIFEEPTAGVAENEGQSVWNKGGWAWEEKDLTRFCREQMTELLPTVAAPPAPIRFVNVTWVKGHAVVTYRQGKKRAGLNWDEVTVQWLMADEAPLSDKGVNGTVKFRDFYSDFAEDMEMEVTVWGQGLSPTEHNALTRCILGFRDKFVEMPALLVEKMMQYKASSPSMQSMGRESS